MYTWDTGSEPGWPHLLPIAYPTGLTEADLTLAFDSRFSSEQMALERHPSHGSDVSLMAGVWIWMRKKMQTGRGRCWVDPEGSPGIGVDLGERRRWRPQGRWQGNDQIEAH